MLKQTWATLFFTALLGFSPSNAFAVEASDLSKVWLPKGSPVTPEAFSKLLELASEDVEAAQLVRDIGARLGASNLSEIASVITICSDETLANNLTGAFRPVYEMTPEYLEPPRLQQGAGEPIAPPAAGLEKFERTTAVQKETYTLTEVAVCIAPEKPLLESFSAFVHELRHFRGLSLRKKAEFSVLDYKNADEYVRAEIEESDGELNAYAQEYAASLRLRKKMNISTPKNTDAYFDADGNLLDRGGLISAIEKMGYRRRLRAEFSDRVVNQYNRAVRAYNRHNRRLSIDTVNVEIAGINVQSLTSDLTYLRRTNAPPEQIAKKEEQIAQWNSDLAFYRKSVSALEAELVRLDKEMRDIKDRFGQSFAASSPK